MNSRAYVPPKAILHIAQTLSKRGRRVYVVGGALRDHALGRRASNDIDLATDAAPDEVKSCFPRVLPTGIKHGTVTILHGGLQVEITTLRVEEGFVDGRRPERVAFVQDIELDLSRRDFTMNAMALDPLTGERFDPFGGMDDIKNGLVRSVGPALIRFGEDGLRPLRAIRFACQLGFEIEAETLAAIGPSLGVFRKVSAERVRDEFMKILLSPDPFRGLKLLERTGLLHEILPELESCKGFEQKGNHRFDVLEHLFWAVATAPPEIVVRLAALLHDSGKPESASFDEDGIPSFHGHERISAKKAQSALKRLKFPNETIVETAHLIELHMFHYTPEWTDAAVRRFIARAGKDNLEKLFALRTADTAAIFGRPPDPEGNKELEKRIRGVIERDEALGLEDLAVGGEELARIGVPKGPLMGRILRDLLETVMDDPSQNEPGRLLRIARALLDKAGSGNREQAGG
ncbi:MAG TPA: HD domain-containing protein [Rectinemataceae bacterium]